MKSKAEIKNQYPFFSDALQASCPGEIFINRYAYMADIIKIGYRDEIRGCTIKSGLPIEEAEQWFLNMGNEYDRMNTSILHLINSHPSTFFNVKDYMTCCSENEYGKDFANTFSKLPTFTSLEESLHTIRLNKAMEESLRHIIEFPPTQSDSLIDYSLDGRPIYLIGKIVPDLLNATYITIAVSDDIAVPSAIILFNTYKEHLYLTLVIETFLEKIIGSDDFQLKSFASISNDERFNIHVDAINSLYYKFDEKLRCHGIIPEPYGRHRKYISLANHRMTIHVFPTFISLWAANLCIAVFRDEELCKYIGYTNMSYSAEGYYCIIGCCHDYIERLTQLVLRELS